MTIADPLLVPAGNNAIAAVRDMEMRFAIFCVLTLISSWIGDDDVVYNCRDRKPNGKERFAAIRYAVVKLCASIYGGGLIALMFIKEVLHTMLAVKISLVAGMLIWLPFIVCVGSLIGVLQNGIRLYQGRPARPLFDYMHYLETLRRWKKIPKQK